jgi:hypothetical protein
VTVHTDANTTFSLGEGSAGSFADLAVSARALVRGTRSQDGSVLAQQVALKAARPPRDEKVKGVIDAIDPGTTSFVLAAKSGHGRDGDSLDLLVHTDANTVFRIEDGGDAAFADLVDGAEVEARGTANGDGSFQATAVEIQQEDEPEPDKIRGEVDSVDAATSRFTLRPGDGHGGDDGEEGDARTFVVLSDANTVFSKPDGSPGSFADVTVGVRAVVEGVRQEGGLLADTVEILAPQPPRQVAVRGMVASVDAASVSFIVQPRDSHGEDSEQRASVVVHTDTTTVFQMSDGSAASFADVVAGARVAVKGGRNADRSVSATLVVIASPEQPQQVKVQGIVTAIDLASGSFTVRARGDDDDADSVVDVVVRTDVNTEFTLDDDEPASFADLAVGAEIHCRGTVNADNSLQASHVDISEGEGEGDDEGD